MGKSQISSLKRFAPYMFVMLLASILILSNLGNQYLWQDEAQTAAIAKTILSHGLPLGYDGRNSFSQEMGAEYGRDRLWRWHTWLQFYVTAASFLVFGTNTFAARLPFALFGLATIALACLFAENLWRSRSAGIYAGVLLATSVPFLLLVKQCRYYSPSAFFVLLSLYFYHKFAQGQKKAAVWFVVSLTLLFHTHHLYCAAVLAAVISHALIFYREKIKTLLLAVAVFALINGPIAVWYYIAMRHRQYTLFSPWVCFSCFTHQLLNYVFPLSLLAIPLFVCSIKLARRKAICFDSRNMSGLTLLILFTASLIVELLIFSPAPSFRYLMPAIPVIILIIALILDSIPKPWKGINIVILVALAINCQMPNYLYEITHDFDGPIEGIVKYLNKHAEPSDTVAISYGDMPLKFYTNLHVIGGLTGESLSLVKKAEWVIIRKHKLCIDDAKVAEYFKHAINKKNYARIVLRYPDTSDENREEPRLHYFRTVTNEDPVVILKRIK